MSAQKPDLMAKASGKSLHWMGVIVARARTFAAANEEAMMKWMCLRRARCLQAIFATLVYLTTASIVHATQTCWRFDQLYRVSDPSAQEKLEAHVKALPGLTNPEIRVIDPHYFMVQAAGKFCKEIPRCEHRLLELRDGVVRNVFAFRGTGAVWRLLSPLGAWLEELQDDYSAWAFEAIDDTFIRVDLPRHGDMIVILPPTPKETNWYKFTCDISTK
jgi:hypothetical protein